MQATFKNKSGNQITGKVISRGFYNVDQPESYEIEVNPFTTVYVAVEKCEVV